jgi:SPX domain protein involved in polyphosphate accumulation
MGPQAYPYWKEGDMEPQLRFQRHELKYYLPQQLYPELIRLIRPYMTLDEHSKKNEAKSYLVRTLYLDTDDLKFYYEKLAGSHTRRKFRIRGYDDSRSSLFLEIKCRYNDIIVKERAVGHYEELDKILNRYGGYHPNGKRSDAEMKVINSYLFSVPILQLRPVVLVAYDREAYTGAFDDSVRLTLDRDLRCLPGRGIDLFYSGTDWFFLNDRCILELKFNHALPFFFERMIKRLNLWGEAISKYCLCIEKCEGLLIK